MHHVQRAPAAGSRAIHLVAAGILALALLSTPGRASSRDVVFFFTSDTHVGFEDKKVTPPVTREQAAAIVRPQVEKLLRLAEEPGVGRPRGIFLAGDLTDNLDWPRFETIFPAAGLGPDRIPLYLGVGNHDGPPGGATRVGLVARNRQHQAAGRLSAISENGLHYALKWDGVHIVGVNLAPADATDADTPFTYGKPGQGSWNDPEGALSFLARYLREQVGSSNEPVVIWQHYGYCEGFNFDWNWWSLPQRRRVYDTLKPYNVVALLHGHTHAAAHYRWPDPTTSAAEVKRLFGESVPADMRSYHVFSAGSLGDGRVYVFRILGDRFIARHRGPDGWTGDPALDAEIRIK